VSGGDLLQALAQPGEEGQHTRPIVGDAAPAGPGGGAHGRVLLDGEAREDALPLRDLHHAHRRDLVGRLLRV
jgi:hypothetical protein